MTPASPRIRIGISACLLGDQVRYDGGHKRDGFLADVLGPLVEWVKVCPEVEIGMGTPRESIRLTDEDGRIRLLTVTTGIDHTDAMAAYAARRTKALAGADLCGYVLKKDSPSCGMTRVKVYRGNGPAARTGVGLFAAALLARLPQLPVLARFHMAHKLALLAHATAAYSRLGRLVAGAASADREVVRTRYSAGFMEALAVPATPKRHVNVLQHMAGYFKDTLDAASRAELLETIDQYRQGLLPLIVPVTLLRHHLQQHDVQYLAGHVYLAPHPKELMLRNHV